MMTPTDPRQVRELFAARAGSRPRAEAPAVTVDGSTARVRLFDPIDSWGEWWGVSAKEFAATLDGLPASVATIELTINSPGGDVFDGVALANLLRAHPARTVAVVQGLAASAASFIAVACDEVVMAANATLMIHDAWGMCVGNAEDMLTMAATLDAVSDNIADFYAAKAGGERAEWRDRMRAETWLTATAAVEDGLADRVEAFASSTGADPAAATSAEVSDAIEASAEAERAATAMRLAAARLSLLDI